MAESPHDLRTCPTRIDGGSVLFAHKVSTATCKERQREGYHKCFTCAYNHAYVAAHGVPVEPAPSEAARADASLTPRAEGAAQPAPAAPRAVRVG